MLIWSHGWLHEVAQRVEDVMVCRVLLDDIPKCNETSVAKNTQKVM